jgi:hypothetical protein
MLNVPCNRWISARKFRERDHGNAKMPSEFPRTERGVVGKFEFVAHVKRNLVGE